MMSRKEHIPYSGVLLFSGTMITFEADNWAIGPKGEG